MVSLPVPPPPRLSPARGAAILAGLSGAVAAAVILWALHDVRIAAAFFGTASVIGGALVIARRLFGPQAVPAQEPDWSVARALAAASPDAVAITDHGGRLICANDRYEALFAGFPTPPGLPLTPADVSALGMAGRDAWRDGVGQVARIGARGVPLSVEIERAGAEEDHLVWRFRGVEEFDLAGRVEAMIGGGVGDRLAGAGVMAALINPDGRIRTANRVLRARAMGREQSEIAGRDFARFLITDSHGLVRFEREGLAGNPLRVLQVPFLDGDDAPMLIVLLDEEESAAGPAIGTDAAAHVRSLVSLMPFGMALVGLDGRFLQMNDAFARAARIDQAAAPLYPGDLVVREDKGVVADAIRRFAGGATHSTDLAIRLKDHPDEPVALSIAGARGLGEAAVLLSLKDNSEESRLKREVAQATKMQAVGQLAGGVAHDFNNILTAIIGHCDLMLMRHSPGDSDYDDIQQVKANSNRAASLTRQLLAFSRQQTLRPQVLQLPDVISEVSQLLKRLLGETVTLTVKHGRSLGPVRADPGQLEQVVVNLAVNARDAMPAGGKLTLATSTVALDPSLDDTIPPTLAAGD
nr:PAS domain-containing protein [Pseudomonadota bacterium]